MALDHVNGYLMTMLQKRLKKCDSCRKEVDCTVITDKLGRIVKKASPKMNFFLRECFKLANELLPQHGAFIRNGISQSLHRQLTIATNVNFPCTVHDTKALVIKRFLHFFIHTWCNNVNSVLKGNDQSWKVDFRDPVKKAARARTEMYRSRNRGGAKIKKLKV